jgi:hypothetical protein
MCRIIRFYLTHCEEDSWRKWEERGNDTCPFKHPSSERIHLLVAQVCTTARWPPMVNWVTNLSVGWIRLSV